MKKIFSNIGKYVSCLIILIISYLILLTLISSIPSQYLETDVRKSADTLLQLGEKKTEGYKQGINFYFTDALMINTAYSIDSTKPLESAMLARKNYMPGVTQVLNTEMPKDLKLTSKDIEGGNYQIKDLYDLIYQNDLYESFEYARYWHGYLVILRPLLIICSFSTMQILSIIIIIIGLSYLLYLLIKEFGIKVATIFLIAFLSIDIITCSRCINQTICFYIAIAFSILILLKYKKIKNIGIWFFVVGSITNFFDLLTNPIITLGIPLTIYFLMENKFEREMDYKETLKKYMLICISWGLGYLLTWGIKWILVDMLYNRNVITNAIEQIMYRSDVKSIDLMAVFAYILYFLNIKVILAILVIIGIYIIVNRNNGEKKAIVIPYILISILPIIWYILTRQHSLSHAFFTYRNLIITIIGILIIVVNCVGIKEIKKEG